MNIESLQGKLIVRPSATSRGKKALLVFGILEYDDVEDVDNQDEMWAVKLNGEALKFVHKDGQGSPTWDTSPEDVLAQFGSLAKPDRWKKKETGDTPAK